LLINKIDAVDYFSFDLPAVKERVFKLNPKAIIIPISAKTGEGIVQWADWLKNEAWKWIEA
jgi:hydrogenase nickel incorporation protein HypB